MRSPSTLTSTRVSRDSLYPVAARWLADRRADRRRTNATSSTRTASARAAPAIEATSMVQSHPIVRTGIMWPGTRLTCSVRSQGSAGPTLCATGLEHPGAPTSERQNRADDEVTRHRSPPLRLGRRATIGRCEVLDRHARWVEQLAPAPLDECCRGEGIHSKVRPSPSSRVEQADGNRRDVHAAGRTGLRCPHRRIDRPVPRPLQPRSVDGRARGGLPHGTHRSGRQPGATRPRSTAVTSTWSCATPRAVG